MKTYVITLSRYFLANHKRAEEETHFKEKFLLGQGLTDYDTPSMAKIHTIRGITLCGRNALRKCRRDVLYYLFDSGRASRIGASRWKLQH